MGMENLYCNVPSEYDLFELFYSQEKYQNLQCVRIVKIL
jgi:hypothetical protein